MKRGVCNGPCGENRWLMSTREGGAIRERYPDVEKLCKPCYVKLRERIVNN